MTVTERLLKGIEDIKAALAGNSSQENAGNEAVGIEALENSRSALEAAAEEVSQVTAQRDSALTDLAASQTALGTAQTELEAANARVTELEAASQTAEERAAQILEAQGVPSGDLRGESNTGGSTRLDEFKALQAAGDFKAAASFYGKHREEILSGK